MKSVLIVTYGRSGSTLLMGLLNSIDGYLIRGENANFFFGLFQSYQSLLETKSHKKSQKTTHPWFGAEVIQEKKVLQGMSNIAKQLILADKLKDESIKCYGFKEIRYADDKVAKKLATYLDFLKLIFPNCKFIFNTRSFADVKNSGWWQKKKDDKVREKLEKLEMAFSEYAKNHSNCFSITYEDVINKTERLKEMFVFLEEEYNEQSIDQVLSIPHSNNVSKTLGTTMVR